MTIQQHWISGTCAIWPAGNIKGFTSTNQAVQVRIPMVPMAAGVRSSQEFMSNFFTWLCEEENPTHSVSELGLLIAVQHVCRRSLSGGVKKQNKTFPEHPGGVEGGKGRRQKAKSDKKGCRSPLWGLVSAPLRSLRYHRRNSKSRPLSSLPPLPLVFHP